MTNQQSAMHQQTIEPVSLEDLPAIAWAMVRELPARLAIGLVGTLGAGKTTMVQAIAAAAGIDVADVTSPTFTLLRSHQGSTLRLHHLDAYRLADEDEFYELGVEELFDEQAWTVVEWADRVRQEMPQDTLWIEIQLTDAPESRRLSFRTGCPQIAMALSRLA
jgi:tRNA threonylcarbamoyladenosine biosynthesis protein TsaE